MVLLDVGYHVVHVQYRLRDCDIDFSIAWENDYSIDRDIVAKHEFPQCFNMPVILPNGIPQLMRLGKSVALVSSVRQILFPKLSITAAIYLPVDIFCLQHKNAVA